MTSVLIPDQLIESDASGKVLFRTGKCRACGTASFPRSPICTGCQSTEIDDETVSSQGEVYSLTEVHVGPPEWHRPARLAYVDLDCGLRVFGHWSGNTAIGSTVFAQIAEVGTRPDGTTLLTYVFTPEESVDA
jgi:uncharacterized OB-fold protein